MANKFIECWLKRSLVFLFTATALCSVVFLLEKSRDVSRYKKLSGVGQIFRNKRGVEDDCLFVLVAKENVKTLTSPNYPRNYPSNADCIWLLTTLEPNATISIRIDSLMIEPEKDCRLDYLQVFLGSNDKAPFLESFCGHVNNKIIETNSSTVLLRFHSDTVYEDRGFTIDYFTPSAKDCKELLTDTSNTLTSPGFPDNYPDDTDCTTLITVGGDKKILLNFESVDLEYGDNCTFDYVQVFDGSDRNSTLLGQICQQTDVKTFESSSNSLLIHFHSDVSVNKKGYRAKYSSVDKRSSPIGNCLWHSGRRNGTISSPNYPDNYPSFSSCSLWILAPEGNRIFITFDALLLEMESNCSYDFLQITEGPPTESKLLGRFCGRVTEPKYLASNGNEVKIEFQSDNFVEFLGFKLRYEFLKDEEEDKDKTLDENVDSGESFKFTVKPQNATIPAGSSYMLHCDTEHPNARIRWLKGEVFLAGSSPLASLKLLENNTVWIQSMQPHLIGLYTCVAVSPEGDIAVTANISMKGRSSDISCDIEMIKSPVDSEFEEGGFAHLECLAAAPGTHMSWEKDGLPLAEEEDHITILKNGYIFMDRIRIDDAGVYTCVARDTTDGCVKKFSAALRVNKRTNIEDICGRPKFGESTEEKSHSDHLKIIGGHNTKKGAYPWQVMLWESERKSFCGATLLNERWIATAAHCIINKYNIPWNKIVIKLGKHDRVEKEDQEVTTEVADSSGIIIHPGFNRMTYDNDIALIRLKRHVHFTDYILPICLGERNLSEALLNGNGDNSKPKMGTVIGWGLLKDKGPSPRYLQEIDLPVVDQQVCKESTTFSVTRNMFCAGYSQEIIGDSCQGDSGGPFQMKHEDRWYMVGLVSWGESCGKKNKYGFYTRLPNHLSWIQGIIKM